MGPQGAHIHPPKGCLPQCPIALSGTTRSTHTPTKRVFTSMPHCIKWDHKEHTYTHQKGVYLSAPLHLVGPQGAHIHPSKGCLPQCPIALSGTTRSTHTPTKRVFTSVPHCIKWDHKEHTYTHQKGVYLSAPLH